MAERTLYDILEVSNSASEESIRAAYERLTAKLDTQDPANTDHAAARVQRDAVKDAFLTLNNPEKRTQYDRQLELRAVAANMRMEVVEPFWTLPKLIVLGMIVLGSGAFYYNHQKQQARLEATQAIAAAKAREAEAQAQAEMETARLQAQRQAQQARDARQAEARLIYERDSAVSQMRQQSAYTRNEMSSDRNQQLRDDYAKRAEEQRIRNEEQRAAAASRQQLIRDKAELCRMEYERYGRTISC